MKEKRFRATVLSGHKEDAVEISFNPATEWGTKTIPFRPRRHGYPVAASIGSISFDSFIVSRMKRLFLLIPDDVGRKNGISTGDQIEIGVSPRG